MRKRIQDFTPQTDYDGKPRYSASELLKGRQDEKLAARPPNIDWHIVRVQNEQKRLQWEQEQARLNQRLSLQQTPWLLRLCRWVGFVE